MMGMILPYQKCGSARLLDGSVLWGMRVGRRRCLHVLPRWLSVDELAYIFEELGKREGTVGFITGVFSEVTLSFDAPIRFAFQLCLGDLSCPY